LQRCYKKAVCISVELLCRIKEQKSRYTHGSNWNKKIQRMVSTPKLERNRDSPITLPRRKAFYESFPETNITKSSNKQVMKGFEEKQITDSSPYQVIAKTKLPGDIPLSSTCSPSKRYSPLIPSRKAKLKKAAKSKTKETIKKCWLKIVEGMSRIEKLFDELNDL
jgi:uncharacterized protein YktA (UPF0223 family)